MISPIHFHSISSNSQLEGILGGPLIESIGVEMLRHLSPVDAHKVLTMTKSPYQDRFGLQMRILSEKKSLDTESLKQYQRIFSCALSPNQGSPVTLSPLAKVLNLWNEGYTSFPGLEQMDLSNCREFTAKEIRALLAFFPNILFLNLKGCAPIAEGTIRELGTLCPKLTHLILPNKDGITDEILHDLTAGCAKLESIDFSGNSHITQATLRSLLEHCPQLTQVDFKDCDLADEEVFDFVQRHPSLQSVVFPSGFHMKEIIIRKIRGENQPLASIDLSNYRTITDELVEIILQHCPNATSIDLSHCQSITSQTVLAIARSYPELERINLSNASSLITDRAIQRLAEGCPRLKSINLSGLDRVGTEAIEAIGRHCYQLGYLNLSRCNRVTDVGIRLLLEQCSNLFSMNLSSCYRVSEEMINTIHQNNIVIFR